MTQGKTQVGDELGLYHLGNPRAHTQSTATDHIRVPPAWPMDPPWKAEIDGQWSQPVLAADWPG